MAKCKTVRDAPKTLPKSAAKIPNAPEGYMFHARIYPGTVLPKANGSPYEGSHVAKMSSTFSKGQPMFESAKDPQLIRTTGGGSHGM